MSNEMRVSVEITSSLGRRINVFVPAQEVAGAIKERLKQVAQTAKVDGFRPGKMPLAAAEKLFGMSVRDEVIRKLVQMKLYDAFRQEQLRPAGYPSIESLKEGEGQPLEFTAAFEIYPEVPAPSLNGVTLEKLVVSVTDSDIERVIEQMRKQHPGEGGALPEVNDDFAKLLGVTEGGLETLRTQIKKHMEQELERVIKSKLKEQVIEKLLERQPLELPKGLIEEEAQQLEREFVESMAKSKQDAEKLPALPEEAKQQIQKTATQRVTMGLLYQALIKEHDIKVDEDRVRAYIDQFAQSFENSPNIMEMLYKDKQITSRIRSQILEEQVVEKLLEQVKFSEKPSSYSEVIKISTHDAHGHDHEHVHGPDCDHDHDH